VHPYLFEHHPERNIRAFFRTMWGTLRPVKFWESMSPAQPSRPKRLIIYWGFSSLLLLLFLVTMWVRAVVALWDLNGYLVFIPARYGQIPVNVPIQTLPSPFSWAHFWEISAFALRRHEGFNFAIFLTVSWIIWPWLMFLALSVFQISMRRAKIRGIHVIRCLVYSYDIGAPLALVASAVTLLSFWVSTNGRLETLDSPLVPLVVVGLLSLIIFRLWAAYRFYLRFSHAFWTIVAAQLMAILGAMAAAVIWNEWIH
jgi:hypothetical protein